MRRVQIWVAIAALAVCLVGKPAQAQPYEANWESLDKRPAPEWFLDAKFGIFIHWGVYAVPAWAPVGNYSEWYWNAMTGAKGKSDPNDGKEDTWEFHKRVYGENFAYHQFAPMFKNELYDPNQWADTFLNSGAKYVVMTSKHHDGYCMWPSAEADRSWGRPWNSVTAGPGRDLLGELTDAVRAKGLKMGFYYSLYEWYNPLWLTDRQVYVEKHMIPQFKDVVTRFKPAIIFSDGEWDMPSKDWKSEELLAWLYNESPSKDEVIVDDRWGKETRHKHGGYFTTEYGAGMADASHPWEENRGMGFSYGYNRNEDLADYRTPRELVVMLVDLVSRGGNLLLDIGPDADGTIPVIMEERLRQMGDWLKINGEAIYDTRMWKTTRQWSEGEQPKVEYGKEYQAKYDVNEITGDKKDGKAVVDAFFTYKEGTLYAITPRWMGGAFSIQDVSVADNTVVTVLGEDKPLEWKKEGNGITINMPVYDQHDLRSQNVFAIKVTNMTK